MEYKFVRFRLKPTFFTGEPKDDYKEIIHQHAHEGWRLVQIFAPAIGGFGKAVFYEIIFEKSAE